MEADVRLDQLLAKLADQGVRFCVVGSFALAVHGAPRASADVDLVPETSIENMQVLVRTLLLLKATDEPGGAPAPLSPEALAAGGEVKLFTELGAVHLLTGVPGVPSYRELEQAAVRVEVLGRQIAFASREDLIRMKQRSGRLIDRADLERLAEAEGEDASG